MCELAKKSENNYFVITSPDFQTQRNHLYHPVIPIKFAVAFLLYRDKKLTGEILNNYIVCFSVKEFDKSDTKLMNLIQRIPLLYKLNSYLSGDEDITKPVDSSTGSPVKISSYKSKYDFSFPIENLKYLHNCSANIEVNQFTHTKHIASGANSNVFLAEYKGCLIVLKLMKEKSVENPIAQREFDLESCMLSRIKHKNIVNFVAASTYPVRFIALEWLGGGTLQDIFNSKVQNNGLLALFKKKQKTLSFLCVLMIARKVAEGLDYLHDKFHEEASIIHRGSLIYFIILIL